MNVRLPSIRTRSLANARGFTIAELMITLTLTALISGGMLATQLYGMRMTELTQTKVHTSDRARQLIRLLTADIQRAQQVMVGNGTASSFTEAAIDTPQQGNALQLYPEANTNVFVRYFWNSTDKALKRVTNTGQLDMVAEAIQNSGIFTAENFAGTILTNRQQNAVIGVDCNFMKLKNPDKPVGPTEYYKSYRLRTRVAVSAL
jgi:type II secretory pathway component PulJ